MFEAWAVSNFSALAAAFWLIEKLKFSLFFCSSRESIFDTFDFVPPSSLFYLVLSCEGIEEDFSVADF